MKLLHFDWQINLPDTTSPDDPITLFTLYYTPEIMDTIIRNTNNYTWYLKNELLPYARANE
jgi:hypothetical protein